MRYIDWFFWSFTDFKFGDGQTPEQVNISGSNFIAANHLDVMRSNLVENGGSISVLMTPHQ